MRNPKGTIRLIGGAILAITGMYFQTDVINGATMLWALGLASATNAIFINPSLILGEK
jgi:hypothetical protein